MHNDKTLFFAGVDWGRGFHQVCIVDQEGSVIAEKSFKHTGSGFFEMARWMKEVSGSDPCNVAVAIEVNHGPVVESLMERGFRVYSINPRQLDRFRDRFCVSGAKDDRRDAVVLASALRTDRPRFRCLEPEDSDIIVLRELNRTREELTGRTHPSRKPFPCPALEVLPPVWRAYRQHRKTMAPGIMGAYALS